MAYFVADAKHDIAALVKALQEAQMERHKMTVAEFMTADPL
jgi:hypothetical protein